MRLCIWRIRLRGAALVAASLLPALVLPQSFNLDLDNFFGSELLGNGAPSPAFAGAAGQVGFWDRLPATGHAPRQLRGLDGGLTSVTLHPTGGTGSALGFNNPTTSGDFRLLMNDAAEVDPQVGFITYTFSGLAPGQYLCYTFAALPQGIVTRTEVHVPGATVETRIVTGPMNGNVFAEGITHAVHDVQVQADLVITVRSTPGRPNSYVNGMQLVLVPEPIGFISMLAGLGGLALARRSRGRRRP